MVKIAPYGTWESPITAESIVQNSVSISDVIVDPVSSIIYHIEKRPNEEGRSVLVKTAGSVDLFGKGWDCRTGVEEYGGAPAQVYNGTLYFSNFVDGRVYALKEGEKPDAITPASDVHRFANFAVHPKQTHLIVAILEDHTKPAPADVVTTLCVINSQTKTVHPLLSGADFYAAPTFSTDGKHIAWQQWNHPDMPWEGGEIYVGQVTSDSEQLSVTKPVHVGGKHKEISATDPFWITDDTLMFTTDVSGFQNPWTYIISTGKAAPVLPQPREEDFSLPGWVLGGSYGAVIYPGDDTRQCTILYSAFRDGRSRLYILTLHSGAIEELDSPYVTVTNVRRVVDGNVVFLGSKVDEDVSLVLCSILTIPHFPNLTISHFTNLIAARSASLPPSLISKPQAITLRIPPNNDPLYVTFYPPTNPDYKAPEGESPPSIVGVHGGPTGNEVQSLNIVIQYFTSRGWAWIGVDYGGSSGHGRAYVDRLKGNWGVTDTRDCVLAVEGLSQSPHNLIDPKRKAIRGGSSGGFTVLATLCDFPTTFAAGTSLYGISDLKKLAEFTHKFESQYMAKLLGGFYDEIPDVYRDRSPVNKADKIKSPLLILQGSLDAVVPPSQAEDIVKTIKAHGGKVKYVLYEGEGHGWRKAETIKAALETELQFYEEIFGLKN